MPYDDGQTLKEAMKHGRNRIVAAVLVVLFVCGVISLARIFL